MRKKIRKFFSWFGYIHQEDLLDALVEYRIENTPKTDVKLVEFEKLIKEYETDKSFTSEALPKLLKAAPELKKEVFQISAVSDFISDFLIKFNNIK